jgi:NADH:ubiquinone oxidoreductase subunit C
VAASFYQRVRELHDRGASLAGIEALAEGEQMHLTYHFLLDGKCEHLVFPQEEGSCPSLIQIYGSADYMERSLHRRYRLKFVGNPNLELGL